MNATPIHDLSDFPLVRFRSSAAQAGYGVAWCAEMDGLVARAERFVLLFPASDRQESHEDRKVRGLWLKQNKEALAGTCLGLIIVEPDAAKRAEIEAQLPGAVRAFGTPQVVVGSWRRRRNSGGGSSQARFRPKSGSALSAVECAGRYAEMHVEHGDT